MLFLYKNVAGLIQQLSRQKFKWIIIPFLLSFTRKILQIQNEWKGYFLKKLCCWDDVSSVTE